MAGSGSSSAVAQFMQYEDCIATVLSTRQAYAYPCFPSMTVCGQQATSRLLSNAAHQRIPRSITSSVSSKLSRSDFVLCPNLGNCL